MAQVSAVLHGSLTPEQILKELPLALGLQLQTQWWMFHFNGGKGVNCKKLRRKTVRRSKEF